MKPNNALGEVGIKRQRLRELLAKEPELESWQLAERLGLSVETVKSMRHHDRKVIQEARKRWTK